MILKVNLIIWIFFIFENHFELKVMKSFILIKKTKE